MEIVTTARFTLKSYASKQVASEALAKHLLVTLSAAILRKGHANLVLTGGSSPLALYECLVAEQDNLAWDRVRFFWGDERIVPLDHPDSNYLLSKAMLDQLGIPAANRISWKTEAPVRVALQHMKAHMPAFPWQKDPFFDAVLLGMGGDGHVASCFPEHAPWTDLRDGFSADVRLISDSPKPPSRRYTFTLPALCNATEVHLLPFGEQKKATLERVLAGDKTLPASYVQGTKVSYIWTDYPIS